MATYRVFLCESRFTSDRAGAVVRPAFISSPGVLLSTFVGSCVSAVLVFPTLSTLSVTSCQLIICWCLTRSPLKPFFCLYLCPAVITPFSPCVCAGTAASAPRLFPGVGVQCADCWWSLQLCFYHANLGLHKPKCLSGVHSSKSKIFCQF